MSDLNLAQPGVPAVAAPRPALSRLNMILVGVALLQLVLVAWIYWPRSTGGGGAPLLGELTPDQITGLRVADAQGEAVELERNQAGWVLAGTDGFPANSETISATLASLVGLTTDRLVTNTAASHARLQVAGDNFVRRITLQTADGEKVLYLGSSGGAGATHVRLEGSDATYLAGGLDTWRLETTPASWVNTAYFSVPQEEIVAFTLQNASGTMAFVKAEDGSWTLQDRAEGEEILSANISTLVTRISSINLTAPLGTVEKPEYGMDAPLATITVQTANEAGESEEHTLLLGAKDDASDSYIFKASTSPYYVRIATYTGDEFANKTRAGFLPTPGEEAGAGGDTSGAQPLLPPVAAPRAITDTGTLTAGQSLTAEAALSATETVTAGQPATTSQ